MLLVQQLGPLLYLAEQLSPAASASFVFGGGRGWKSGFQAPVLADASGAGGGQGWGRGTVCAGNMLDVYHPSVLPPLLQELSHGAAAPAEIPAPRLSPPSFRSTGLCPHACSQEPGR